jgi:hypothetical protein
VEGAAAAAAPRACRGVVAEVLGAAAPVEVAVSVGAVGSEEGKALAAADSPGAVFQVVAAARVVSREAEGPGAAAGSREIRDSVAGGPSMAADSLEAGLPMVAVNSSVAAGPMEVGSSTVVVSPEAAFQEAVAAWWGAVGRTANRVSTGDRGPVALVSTVRP